MDFIIKPTNNDGKKQLSPSSLMLDMILNNIRSSKSRDELISGRRLKEICALSGPSDGLADIPLIIRNIGDDDACILEADSNILHTDILPSEKAWAYKTKLDTVKCQGIRTDLSDRKNGVKFSSAKFVGKEFNDSRSQVHRYIRLTKLIPELLEMVDNQTLSFCSGTELSFLSYEEQEFLYYVIVTENIIPTIVQAKELKKLSQSYTLGKNDIYKILKGESINPKIKLEISSENLSKYFPTSSTPETIEKTILKALELYTTIQRSMGTQGGNIN